MPVASSSSAANAGHSAADSRLSRSKSSSPKSASVTGASIPAATEDAPQPGSARSRTTTRSPDWAARQADVRPAMPAPSTATSKFSCVSFSLRRHYPDQVLAVGGAQPPSQPGLPGLPSRMMLEPVRYLVALANDFTVGGRRSGCAIDGRRTRPVRPDRGVEQRDQQADDAHDEQDRANRGDLNAGNRCRYCEPENRTKRDQEDGCPYPHWFSSLEDWLHPGGTTDDRGPNTATRPLLSSYVFR